MRIRNLIKVFMTSLLLVVSMSLQAREPMFIPYEEAFEGAIVKLSVNFSGVGEAIITPCPDADPRCKTLRMKMTKNTTATVAGQLTAISPKLIVPKTDILVFYLPKTNEVTRLVW